MRKVIRIDEPKEKSKKPVEFTHCLQKLNNSFYKSDYETSDYVEIIHIGNHYSKNDGILDVFRAKTIDGAYFYFLGHLNSGEY